MNVKTRHLLEFERVQNAVAAYVRADEAAALLLEQAPITEKSSLALLIRNIKQIITLINSSAAEPRGTLPPLAAVLKKLGVEGLYFNIEELYALGVFLEEGIRISNWAGALFNAVCPEAREDAANAAANAAAFAAAKIIFSVIDRDGKFRDTSETRRIKAKISEIHREIQALTASYSRNEATRFMLRSGPPSIREGRTVIALKANFRGRIRGIVHEVSASGQTLFIEPEDVVEKNNGLRIAEHELDAEIRRVLAETSAALSPHKNDITIFYTGLIYFETLRARAHHAIASKGIFAADVSAAAPSKSTMPSKFVEQAIRSKILKPADNIDKKTTKQCFLKFGNIENNNGIKKIAARFPNNAAGKILTDKGFDTRLIVPYLDELFRTAIFLYSENEHPQKVRPDGSPHKAHPDVIFYHNYLNKFKIDSGIYIGREYYIRFVVYEKKKECLIHSTFVSYAALYADLGSINFRDNNRTKEPNDRADFNLSNFFNSVKPRTAVSAADAAGASGFMLRGARHPLLKNAVPIDIEMNDNIRALVISGPNAGGKTAALKTAGLFALMNQCGFALPAGDAALPIFDDIFCDIGDEQSLDGALSTFSAHIKNISGILKNATKHSLILLDELGTGTGIEEGAALAMALLDTFIERGAMLVVSTHAGALKNYALTNRAAGNASVEFDAKTQQPTYRLVNGIPGESRAIVIAEKNGISAGIIARARAYLEHGDADSARVIAALLEKNAYILREKDALDAEKAAFAAQKEKFAAREKKILEKEAAIKAGDAGELRALLNESRKKLENLVRSIQEQSGKLEREDTLAVKGFLRELEDNVRAAVLDDGVDDADGANAADGAFAEGTADSAADGAAPFTPGAQVLVGERRRPGVIKRRGKKGAWIVEIGSVSLAFSENELLLAPKRASAAKNAAAPSVLLELSPCGEPVHAEIDLHGMRLADAIEALRRQLDMAITAGLSRFAVIHGAGDGILQRGVHEFLKEHSAINGGVVENYYFSRPELGGIGRTEVELRG